MKRIIIIDHEPLSIRRKAIFHIDDLIRYGFDAEHWDMSQYFHPGMIIPDTLDTSYSRQLKDLQEFEDQLRQVDIPKTLFIVETFDQWSNRKFFRMLSRYQCYTIKLELYSTATLNGLPILQMIRTTPPVRLAKGILHRFQSFSYTLYKHIHSIHNYQYYIRSGCKQAADLYINHPDWEQYITAREHPCVPNRKYAVFLDEYFPLHPDLKYLLKLAPTAAQTYYSRLNHFFTQVEQDYDLQVIIAAHPKSNYPSGTFGDRSIQKYQTVNLVRDAELVLMHSSASFAFALMFDKPIILFTTDSYTRSKPQYQHLLRLSRFAQLPIIDIDRQGIAKWESHHIPTATRQQYIYDYLTSPDIETQKTAEILCRSLAML